MKRALVSLIVLLLVGSACSPPSLTTSPAPGTVPAASESPDVPSATPPGTPEVFEKAKYEPADCPQDAVGGIGPAATCGYLTVPENRTAAQSRPIRLLVVSVSPGEAPSPDPMIVLGLDIPWTTNYPGVAPLAARVHREVIVLAQRGSGRSDPSLVCTELEDLADVRLPAELDDPDAIVDFASKDAFLAAVKACHDRLVGEGVDLAAYNLVESAADVEDLRAALGIEEFNLITLGTASRIAFEVMRRHPEHLRSVVLDTPSVPQADMFTEAIVGTRASVGALSAECRRNPNCAAAYPNLEAALATAMARLAATPIRATIYERDVLLDEVTVLRWIRTALASKEFGRVPSVIQQFADEANTVPPRSAASNVLSWPILSHGYVGEGAPSEVSPGSWDGDFSHGLLYSIACHDHLPQLNRETLIEATRNDPWYRKAYLDSPFQEICELWDVGSGEGSVSEPVVSSIPTLLLVGAFDPFGVPDLVREAAESLDRSWVVEIPAHSHNVLGYDIDPCPLAIRNAWVDAPTSAPDPSCVNEIPPVLFSLP
jgi:pimeloyl-ACP methyl ester carboxylesterase